MGRKTVKALFNSIRVFSVIEGQKQRFKDAFTQVSDAELVADPNGTSARLVDEFSMNVPVLDEEHKYAVPKEVQVDVSQDLRRRFFDRSRPHYVSGTEVTIIVPFQGDLAVFDVQPTSYATSPPIADVRDGEIHLVYTLTDIEAGFDVEAAAGKVIEQIRQYLDNLRPSAEELRRDLQQLATSLIEKRRQARGAHNQILAGLKMPVVKAPPPPNPAPAFRPKLGTPAVTRTKSSPTQTAGEHARFQRMAIDEAKRSIPENDGRIHPKVGVVIVKDGRVLATAHRGEIPKGHAEFIALEEKLADVSVVGATVYATLEPCTTRNHPKVPCATRLAERGVARVYIGMLDPNPDIRGLGQQLLSEAGIETQLFPQELMAEVIELNRDFSREQKQKPRSLPSDAKAPESVGKPPTLSDLFTQDLANTMKLTNESTATFADGSILNIKRQLYLDFSANVKFVGFYVPSSDPLSNAKTLEVCLALADTVGQTVDELQKQVVIAAGFRGEMTDAKNLVFSGRALVYHEAFLSIPQKAAIIEAFAKKQVDVQFRGPDYLGDQVISWHHKHDPKPER